MRYHIVNAGLCVAGWKAQEKMPKMSDEGLMTLPSPPLYENRATAPILKVACKFSQLLCGQLSPTHSNRNAPVQMERQYALS